MESSELPEPKIEFDIQPVVEQTPFKNPAVQSFFNEWCKANDSIQPKFTSRDEWEKRGIKRILEKKKKGNQTLYIPEDLHLWEMVGVMEVVDHDTFAKHPERKDKAKEKLAKLGTTFRNAGIYIAQRLDSFDTQVDGETQTLPGKLIAKALAEEFYAYGLSLSEGKKSEVQLATEDIASQSLTDRETQEIDQFLAGESLYESRKRKAEKKIAGDPPKRGEIYEEERRKTLVQFFGVTEKAFRLETQMEYKKDEVAASNLKPWQSEAPLHVAFLKKVEEELAKEVETPKRELNDAMFRRGLAKLASEMRETKMTGWREKVTSFFENIGINIQLEKRTLYKALEIKRLKRELEAVRRTGNVERISEKEKEIADRIQGEVSKFPYKENLSNPSEMIANQFVNCVGASELGGTLMQEAGLNYLVGNLPEHSILFLVTSNGKVEWRDMQTSKHNEQISDEVISGQKEGGSPLTVRDIVEFSENPKPEGLDFIIEEKRYREKLCLKENQQLNITLFPPEYGQKIQLLDNIAGSLINLKSYAEAAEASRLAIELSPRNSVCYYILAYSFYKLMSWQGTSVTHR